MHSGNFGVKRSFFFSSSSSFVLRGGRGELGGKGVSLLYLDTLENFRRRINALEGKSTPQKSKLCLQVIEEINE